jgi:hypothetical protein
MKLLKKINFLISGLCILLALSTSSCFTVKYSTSGASISPDMKTASIGFFQNRAPIVRATLGQQFTDLLRQKIQQNTSLTVITEGGDASFEGEITGYGTTPQSLQANDVAAQNRLTITVRVKFVNSTDPKFSFDTSFSRYLDYSSNQTLEAVEGELAPKILDNLVEDIFNKAFANW